MSSALAIAAVTASLLDRLNEGLLNNDLSSIGSFSVTAKPPDQISKGQADVNQINLFLYQVTPNPGWRNVDLPSRDNAGTRVTNPPLALDLHYLMTAYGAADMNAEILLGYGMQLLHQFPGLSRKQLRDSLVGSVSLVDGTILPGIFGNLSALDLADQIELIKISPQYLSADDLSKLWTAMQARYRPSMAYLVSVVLIQGTGSTKAPLPVLKRGPDDRGPTAVGAPFPALAAVRPDAPVELPAMRLGDDLVITGSNLGSQGGMTAILENSKAALVQELVVSAGKAVGALSVHVPSVTDKPSAVNEWAVGMYVLRLRVRVPELNRTWLTNEVPIALAPTINIDPPAVLPDFHAGETVTITCRPRILKQQEAGTVVIFGAQTVAPVTIVTPDATPADKLEPTTLTFKVPAGLPVVPGTPDVIIVRLRVDGVDSIPIMVSASPPKLTFAGDQKVTVS